MPNTTFFEVDSAVVGGRFGIWVTVPPEYGLNDVQAYPVIYVLDGNWAAGLLAPLAQLVSYDPLDSYTPYLQVSVGYAGPEAAQETTLRIRDLIPPGEPISESTKAVIDAEVDAGRLTSEEADAMIAGLHDTHADRFLEFLESELHPQIEDRYRIEAANAATGLFGYSYGGLFVLYALLRRTAVFRRFGAGSPGISTAQSEIFRMHRELKAAAGALDGCELHLTVNQRELTGNSWFLRDLVNQSMRFVDELYLAGHDGLRFSSRILGDTHATGCTSAFLSFLQACYVRARESS